MTRTYFDRTANDPAEEYTVDEVRFMLAMDAYKRHHHRPWPTWREVMAVFYSCGWRRTEEPGPPPRPRNLGEPKRERG